MNQAILNLIDEMNENNKKSSDYFNDKLAWPVREAILNEIKSKISSLPSDTQWIDTLQRYTNYKNGSWGQFKSNDWEYIRYDDLKKLLED